MKNVLPQKYEGEGASGSEVGRVGLIQNTPQAPINEACPAKFAQRVRLHVWLLSTTLP